MEQKYLALRYEFWHEILDRKHWVMYLYPPSFDLRDMKDLLASGRMNPVSSVIEEYTKAYMVEGKEPPMAIAGAIKNFADDIACGREVVVRAGDYIAINNYLREEGKAGL
jgi:hypothetical protein